MVKAALLTVHSRLGTGGDLLPASLRTGPIPMAETKCTVFTTVQPSNVGTIEETVISRAETLEKGQWVMLFAA